MVEKHDSKYKRFFETAFSTVKRVLRAYSDKFSKKTYTQHQHAVAILLMKYENKPYRDIVELMKELWEYFGFKSSVPHFTTLQKFFARIPARLWEFLLTKTYQLFGTKSANIGVDATGFRPSHISHYYYSRFKDIIRRKRYMKHSISVDTDKQAILSSINAISWRNDIVYFEPLVKKSRAIVSLKNVTADMGYDSESNHVFVREIVGGVSIIPPRPVKSGNMTKGHYRKQLIASFPVHKYHQRSKVETVNFVEKRKFGDELRSRLLKMQKRELRVIDVVYNLYRYINYFCLYLLGFLQGFNIIHFAGLTLPDEGVIPFFIRYLFTRLKISTCPLLFR